MRASLKAASGLYALLQCSMHALSTSLEQAANPVESSAPAIAHRRQGPGKLVFPSGDAIEGVFREDQIQGEGRYTNEDGSYMIAHYVDGELHGPYSEFDEDGDPGEEWQLPPRRACRCGGNVFSCLHAESFSAALIYCPHVQPMNLGSMPWQAGAPFLPSAGKKQPHSTPCALPARIYTPCPWAMPAGTATWFFPVGGWLCGTVDLETGAAHGSACYTYPGGAIQLAGRWGQGLMAAATWQESSSSSPAKGEGAASAIPAAATTAAATAPAGLKAALQALPCRKRRRCEEPGAAGPTTDATGTAGSSRER